MNPESARLTHRLAQKKLRKWERRRLRAEKLQHQISQTSSEGEQDCKKCKKSGANTSCDADAFCDADALCYADSIGDADTNLGVPT